MKSIAFQRAIDAAVRSADLTSLADHLADDVELNVAIGVASSPSLKRLGKRAVVEHLRSLAVVSPESPRGPSELFAEGERIVALCDEPVAIACGLALRAACAMVFDIEGESITRVGIHFEIRPSVESALPAGRNGAPAAQTGRARRRRRDRSLSGDETPFAHDAKEPN